MSMAFGDDDDDFGGGKKKKATNLFNDSDEEEMRPSMVIKKQGGPAPPKPSAGPKPLPKVPGAKNTAVGPPPKANDFKSSDPKKKKTIAFADEDSDGSDDFMVVPRPG